ncbi:MAG: hypothetical protein ACYCY1_03705 [Sulfuriferula sp.]
MAQSPYLINGRLEKVLAAIQILGSYEWASRESIEWSKKLDTAQENEAWLQIFKDHPEFFRIGSKDWISLRWRHGYDRTYLVSERKDITIEQTERLPESEQKNKLSRKPLSPEQIAGLMKTAIELHGRAIAQRKERRWLLPFLFPLLGAILGGIAGSGLTTLLK